jgi:hypothetical protein
MSVAAIGLGRQVTVSPVTGPPDLFDGAGGLLGRLGAWAAEARADEAVASRAREAFLRRTAGEDATFAGVVLDLAERGAPVVVAVGPGRRHRGTVAAVGADFCALRSADGRLVFVAFRGIASVRPEGRAPTATGDRPVQLPAGLAEALAVAVEDRPRVLVSLSAEEQGLAGVLRSVGRDVLVLQLDGADRPTAYVPLANVAAIAIA